MSWPFSRRIEVKENPVGAAFMVPGGAQWKAPASRRAYVEEGYQLNVIVYRAVCEITRAIGDMEIEVARVSTDPKAKAEVLANHPALAVLNRPNPTQGGDGFLVEMFTNYMLTGEMACTRFPETGKPVELWAANPLYITIEPGRGGIPARYVYEQGNVKRAFAVTYPTGVSQMFFQKMYNPLDYWRGQSPLVAASLAADTHNAGMKWNYSLLRNSARPSGLIKLTADSGGEVIARLKEWFKSAFQGEQNAGAIPVLPAGAEWQAMDQSARDMDFMNTQREAAKLIASAYGVPLPLIDNDASTFNNVEQAKERLYTDTVLPIFRSFLAQFGAWFLPAWGDGLTLQVNEDNIGALEGIRTRLFDRMVKAVQADVLTRDEAREALGYEPLGDDNAPDDVSNAVKLLAYGETKAVPAPDKMADILRNYLGGDSAAN